MEEQERRTKIQRKRRREEEGWEDINPDDGRWHVKKLFAVSPGARVVGLSRHSRISDVFLSLLSPAVLHAARSEIGAEKLVYNNVRVPLKLLYEMYAISLLLRAERWKLENRGAKNAMQMIYHHIREVFPDAMGFNKFKWLRNNFYITPEVARGKLSKRFRAHLAFGEFVAMDEKQKKWRGGSEHIKKVLSKKNDPVGHWNTQACAVLNVSSEPFIFGIYPFSGRKSQESSVETRETIWTWLLNLVGKVKKYPVICTDSFYLDNTSRSLLLEKQVPYHCSIKSSWYAPLHKHLSSQVTEMNQWAAMYNKHSKEICVYSWNSEKGVGKKLLLSTLMEKRPGKQPTESPPGWELYKYMFNGCDHFNKDVSAFFWPYRLARWEMHFDEIFQLHVILNTIAIWRELQESVRMIPKKELMVQLAHELYQRARKDDLPPSLWK